jgi:putative hydrolase of the HAD superfamily
LLLDIGGVILRPATVLAEALANSEPRLRPTVTALAIGTEHDELWQRMLRCEISERAYWAQRAAELGAAIGQQWDTRTMINRMYDRPDADWLDADCVALMADASAAGIPLGALTNDLADFHGREWMEQQEWLKPFDVIVDASVTGVLKPDPRAFAAGAAALQLDPSEVVYLDDMPWNAAAGAAAGLQAIEVSYAAPQLAFDEARSRLGLSPRAGPEAPRPEAPRPEAPRPEAPRGLDAPRGLPCASDAHVA